MAAAPAAKPEDCEEWQMRTRGTGRAHAGRPAVGPGHRVPFGLDRAGRVVWPREVDPIEGFGERCGLRCAVCGEPILAVRRSRSDPMRGISHFAHKSNSACSGMGESAIHRAAKSMLASLVGQPLMLPPLSPRDCVAHVSRLSASGRRSPLPEVPLPGHEGLTMPDFPMRGSSQRARVEEVLLEHDCARWAPGGLVPDAMVRLSGSDVPVAMEFRATHPKGLGDVRAYAAAGIPVVEVRLGGLACSQGLEDELRWRITGLTPEGPRFKDREWLWNPSSWAFLAAHYVPALVKSPGDAWVPGTLRRLGECSLALVPSSGGPGGAIVIEALTWDGLDGLFRDADSQPDRQRETDIPEGAEETVPVESEPESGGDAEGPELNPTTEPTARPRRGVLGGIRLLADRFGKWFPGR